MINKTQDLAEFCESIWRKIHLETNEGLGDMNVSLESNDINIEQTNMLPWELIHDYVGRRQTWFDKLDSGIVMNHQRIWTLQYRTCQHCSLHKCEPETCTCSLYKVNLQPAIVFV